MDRHDDPLTQQARAHAIPVGPGTEDPPPIQHPRRNQTIYPWIDFFAYWQVYELVEILKAAVLFQPIQDTPDVLGRIEGTLARYKDFHELAQLRIAAVQNAWAERQAVFGWISRYRTLLGTWIGTHSGWEKVREAAPQLLEQLGVTPEELKQSIRDTLLTLWHRWEPWRGKHDVVPRLVRLHLQEDIALAVEFLSEATGKEIDLDDPFWGVSKDGMNRGWTPLPEALPYEAFTAKADFPIQASIYLERTNRLFPQPFDEGLLHELTERWWPKSVAFRRFCLAFRRLHQVFDSTDESISLRESTPVEFLILCTLHAEKILRDRFLEGRTGSHAPNFSHLIRESAEVVQRSLKLNWSEAEKGKLQEALQRRSKLHDLAVNPRDPFLSTSDFSDSEQPSLTDYLLTWFSNFAILRNYAAHHDSLDHELIHTPMAEDAIEALLVVTVTVLHS